ncbi:hypothetical protein AV530_012364 [Patagioenas fasciata monilis]|uniref:Uncharacterized protein n=1 Tax=Patagioenas fasciata monilis TaxID=372326 RepID=A0A1V4JB13_PATFA|nr:hypothetical protein AV530_012364 [Patagioenas fasciata monilis]
MQWYIVHISIQTLSYQFDFLSNFSPGRHVVPTSRQAPNSNRETISSANSSRARKCWSCCFPPYLLSGWGVGFVLVPFNGE